MRARTLGHAGIAVKEQHTVRPPAKAEPHVLALVMASNIVAMRRETNRVWVRERQIKGVCYGTHRRQYVADTGIFNSIA